MKPMKVLLLSSFILIGSLLSASQAMADSDWYLGLGAGANLAFDQRSTGPNRDVNIDFDTGPAFFGFVGYKFDEMGFGRFRAELEGSYRNNNVGSVTFNGNPFNDGRGKTEVWAGMANAYFDWTAFSREVTPYFGVGLGGATIDQRSAYGAIASIDDSDAALAYQLIGGLSYKATSRINVNLDIRYFALDEPDLVRFGGPPPLVDFVKLDSEYDALTIGMSFSYNF